MENRLNLLEQNVKSKLKQQGFLENQIHVEYFLHLRYEGTDCALMVTPNGKQNPIGDNPKHGDFLSTFLERSLFIFKFSLSFRIFFF